MPRALKSYRDSLGIFEKLAKQDPGHAGRQRDLLQRAGCLVAEFEAGIAATLLIR